MTDADAILAANAAYYRALATRDFAEMSRIWADDGVSCVHAGWPALIGRADILESYRKILHRSPNRVWIDYHDDTAIVSGDEGRVLCVEVIEGTALAATNCYRRVDGAWRMIHHQACPIARVEESAPRSQRLN